MVNCAICAIHYWRLTHARPIVLHEGEKVVKRDSRAAGEDSIGVSQGLSLVEKQFTELLFLLGREVADHHGKQLRVREGGETVETNTV